jgi:hypothetical protein
MYQVLLLFTPYGSFDSVRSGISFDAADVASDEINGSLRHLSKYDLPLDQSTQVTGHYGVNTLKDNVGVNNSNTWYMFDYQMGYDPCVCEQFSRMTLNFYAVKSSNIILYGRSISLVENLVGSDGEPMYDDGFLSVQNVNNGVEDGYIMRDRLASLVEDYNTSLDTYQDALDEQRVGQIGWAQDVLGDAASLFISGLVGELPIGEISRFLVDSRLTLGADSTNVVSFINKGATALLGQGYDFLSTTIFGDNVDPVRPSIPTASFSEMRFSGDVTESNLVPLTGFLTPGNSISGANITPITYPAYNKPVGLYATLKTPRPDVLLFDDLAEEDTLDILTEADSSEYLATNQFPPVYIHYDTTIVKSKKIDHAVYLRLTENLEYALNNAVDFDMDETQIYFSCQVTMENGLEWSYSDVNMIDSVSNSFSDNTNLWPLHDLKNIDSPLSFLGNSQRRIELTSGWYEIEDITDLLFGTTFESTTYYQEHYETSIYEGPTGFGIPWEDEFDSDIPNTETDVIKFRPVKIELKILADMTFEQLSSSGEDINTTQVFTYLVYDEDESVNFLGNDGDFVSGSNISSFVNMFPGDLTIESNILFPNAPEILISNFGNNNFAVVAENIIVNDDLEGLTDSNGQGAVYDLQAYTKIHLQEGAHLSPNLHLEINRDIYGGPTSLPATETELLTFCDPDSNYYQANNDAAAILTSPPNQEGSTEFVAPLEIFNRGSVTLYPNPARDLLTLRSSHLELSSITIHDLSGRPIKQETLQSNTRETQVNLSGIAPGTYIVRVDCGDEVFSEKLVVTR